MKTDEHEWAGQVFAKKEPRFKKQAGLNGPQLKMVR
jgi:hypothetical protein